MRLYRTVASLGFLIVTSCACLAQSATAARQPQPVAESSSTSGAGPVDLDATRKRFDVNSAKTADRDRKRDAKLRQSMGSICAGCEAAPPAKRSRATRPAPEPSGREDETSPAE